MSEAREQTTAVGTNELFVPGRLCLFGEHSDWAGALRAQDPSIEAGACILTGTDQGITAAVEADVDFLVSSPLADGGEGRPFRVPMEETALRRSASAGGFFSYVAGVAAVVCRRYGCGGVALREHSCDLPLARGLSSSAAICVLTARAFNQIHGLGLDVREEMEIAYLGELAAGSQCGRMDQACAYGRRLVQLRLDGDEMAVEVLRPGRVLHLLIVDLEHPKDTRRILDDLHRAFARGGETRAALGRHNRDIVAAARAALEHGDGGSMGALMEEAQSLFDRVLAPASPELSAPRLHAALAHPSARALAWGGKGVGSQGDGAAQFVCRGAEERDELARQLSSAGLGTCLPLTIEPSPPFLSDSENDG